MPRMARVVLPNYPHHVVQRGHDRQVVFAGAGDCRRYLRDLRELKEAFDVRVYAYCLMTNHVHLLLSPGERASGLGRLMKALAARATRYRNRLERRSGTLWEGRYKSSVVDSDAYLLACCRYIELNPVRAKKERINCRECPLRTMISIRALRTNSLFALIVLLILCGCPQIASIQTSASKWIGHPYRDREELMGRPEGYAHMIGWHEQRYRLVNGNYVYIEPARPGCFIHWEVDQANIIVGVKTEGDRCF